MSKPRVASYYEHRLGRNDGNPLYVTNVFKRDYAKTIDFNHLIPDPDCFLEIFAGQDLNIWIDWAEDALYHNGLLAYKPAFPPKPSLYWASDTHLGPKYRTEAAKLFSWVCVAQKAAIDLFREGGVEAPIIWLPHAVEPDCYNPLATNTYTDALRVQAWSATTIKDYDVSFVGYLTFQNRQDFLDAVYKGIQKQGRTFWHASRFFEDAARIFTHSRIVLNHAIKDDVNMRVFEVLATRSFLLTPMVPSLDELFVDRVHLVTYRDGDVDDCLEKIAYYTDHEDERERIAEAGYREVLAHHTFKHRVERMLEIAGIKV
mgnify:CR=1 FL=1